MKWELMWRNIKKLSKSTNEGGERKKLNINGFAIYTLPNSQSSKKKSEGRTTRFTAQSIHVYSVINPRGLKECCV